MKWIKKLFGYHVCETFTQWKVYTGDFERAPTMEETVWAKKTTIHYTRRWQERKCTVCGKLEREYIK